MARGGIEDLVTKADLERFIGESVERNPIPMSGVDGLTAALQPGAWQPLGLEGAWVTYGEGFAPPAYRTIPGGRVELRGLVKSGAGGTTVATLPVAARPKYQHGYDANSEGVAHRIDVTPAGAIVFSGVVSPAYVSLDGIVIPVGG